MRSAQLGIVESQEGSLPVCLKVGTLIIFKTGKVYVHIKKNKTKQWHLWVQRTAARHPENPQRTQTMCMRYNLSLSDP